MNQPATFPSETPLLGPSEWLVFRAVQEAASPLTITQIANRWPSLAPSTLAGILERLVGRRLLEAQGGGWMVASRVDPMALLSRMIEHWLAIHAVDTPEHLAALARILDRHLERAVSPPH